jgi:hypothetical protein
MRSRWSLSLCPLVLLTVGSASLAVPARARSRSAHLTGWDAAAVERAREGAARRLQSPECQKVLTDFRDAEGRTIRENLEIWRMSPAEYLRIIPFVDGSGEKLCRSRRIALVATPDVRRVIVCPAFADLQLRQPREAESMVIHELLHTLGLGENPPTSIEITRRVESRCH